MVVVIVLAASSLVALLPSSAQFGGGLDCPAGAPPNDCFEDAVEVDENPFEVRQSTVGATTSKGENTNCGLLPSMGATVWYRYSPENSSQVTVDTEGSDYDTVLAVSLLTDQGVLLQIRCNDDVPDNKTSNVSWPARGGPIISSRSAGSRCSRARSRASSG